MRIFRCAWKYMQGECCAICIYFLISIGLITYSFGSSYSSVCNYSKLCPLFKLIIVGRARALGAWCAGQTWELSEIMDFSLPPVLQGEHGHHCQQDKSVRLGTLSSHGPEGENGPCSCSITFSFSSLYPGSINPLISMIYQKAHTPAPLA